MDPRSVVDYLKVLCRDLDEGRRPNRFNLRRILAPVAVPAAMTFALGAPGCLEPVEDDEEVICDDGFDNDDDGWVDCDDADCDEDEACIAIALYAVPMEEIDCTDGLDNDEDGFIDCDDSDCEMDDACRMIALYAAPMPERDCSDGIDNDLDGLIDCDDPQCFRDDDCLGGAPEYAAPFLD